MATSIDEIIKEAVLKTVKHIHDREYVGLIVSGRSHVIAKSFFEAGWENLYPNENHPAFYVFDGDINETLYKGNRLQALERQRLVNAYIEEHMPLLSRLRRERLCYLEEFSSKGQKYRAVKDIFQRLIFLNLDFCFFSCKEKPDPDVFVGLEDDLWVGGVTSHLYALASGLSGITFSPLDLGKPVSEIISRSEQSVQRIRGYIRSKE